jgi:hypothetical protein
MYCSLYKCQKLYDICQTAKQQVGQGQQLLFKNVDILQLTEDMRVFQGWSRQHRAAPITWRQSWQAVLRMEQTWCRESDGTILHPSDDDADNNSNDDENSLCQPDDGDRLVFGNVNVDPWLNLPDPTDERRVKYIEERKRPQIQWMIQLIQPPQGERQHYSWLMSVEDVEILQWLWLPVLLAVNSPRRSRATRPLLTLL